MPCTPRSVVRQLVYQREQQRHGIVPCYVCSLHVKWAVASLEHMLPKALGGTNHRSNLAISHRDCNSRRGHKILAHRAPGAIHQRTNMETMQQPKITGYRQLSQADADLMNAIKAHAEQTRELVNRVMVHAQDQINEPLPEGRAPHSQVTHPMRWAQEAQTDLQKGYMSLVRAVARPSTF